MRTAVCILAICCCLSAAGARWLGATAALPDERPASLGMAVASRPPAPAGVRFRVSIGAVDTIGGTTYDRQASGPAWRMLVNAPGHGIHAAFMRSSDADTLFTDRNMRYNFYNDSTGEWSWIDSTNFMGSGFNVFTMRTGYGSIDADTNGVAVISAHHSTGSGQADYAPIVARDAVPGYGIFSYVAGEPTLNHYEWPCIGVGMNGCCHLAMIEASGPGDLYWSRLDSTWHPPVSIGSAGHPTHNMATSKVAGSNKVCITWVASPASGYGQMPGFYRESPDGGDTWYALVELGFPPAFSPGSETLPSYMTTSLFPFYDMHDRLHIVASVHAYVRDTNYVAPSELWHFCPGNDPQWARIHRAGAFNPQNSNPTYACRPSIGEDAWGGLYVAWEQFDSSNIEPGPPACARADIFYAQDNGDNGASWKPGVRITDQDTWTCRFPSAIDHFTGDTFRILYLIDKHAGSFITGQGPATNNPVVVHKVPVTVGIAAGKYQVAARLRPTASIVRGVLSLAEAPSHKPQAASLLDISGRKVMDLRLGANDVRALAPGVYFCRLTAGFASSAEAQAQAQAQAIRKVVITR